MTPPKLRFGILGAANIARKNWKAIQLTGNSTVTAVASRDASRCRQFIAECQAEAPMDATPQAFDDYHALIESDAVDAVYLPLPTGLRKPLILSAAAAHKHVVCEKPCATSAGDLREMLDACQHHGVQFIDGVMFRHSRRLDQLRGVLEDGISVGEVQRVTSAFSFRESPDWLNSNIRTHSALEPAGCLGDLGWYCIQFALWLKRWELPQQITGRLLAEHHRPDSPAPVPTTFSGELIFADGLSSSFHCSFSIETEQWARISGQWGSISLADFVLPFAGAEVGFDLHSSDFQVRGCDFRMTEQTRRYTVPEVSHGHANAQETNLFRSFATQVLSGQLNLTWPDASLKTQIVMDACLDSSRAGSQPITPERL